MSEEIINEETYSVIYSSLKHPIRRKILRMLDGNELTYSEILEALAIDSGHLGYHLDNLGDLITHLSNGKYGLSTFGKAAVTLMSGVEEPSKKTKSKRNRTLKLLSIGLASILLIMSLYAVTFTVTDFSNFTEAFTPVVILQEGYSVKAIINFTNYVSSNELEYGGNHLTRDFGENDSLIGFVSTLNYLNTKFLDTKYGNSLDVVTKYHLSLMVAGNQSVFPMTLQVWDRNGKEFSPSQNKESESHALTAELGEITQLGAYRIDEYYIGSEPLQTGTSITVLREQTQKPLFYYGLVGIITSSLYLIVALAFWSKANKTKGDPKKGKNLYSAA